MTTQQLALDATPSLRDAVEVRYEIVGPRGAPVIAVLGGISASKHVTSSVPDPSRGWWEDVVGPERAIDTRQFQVIGIDYVTSAENSTPVTTTDQAEALAAALDQTGIHALHAVVGASYGGMVALAFGARFPTRAKRLIVISAAHESDPIATALRHLQRRVVELGSAVGRERDGLAIARGIAITSYLTPRHFEERVAGVDRSDSRAVEDRIGSYLKTRGDQFAEQWTPERYNALSLSLDLHKIRPEDIAVPTTVIAITGDRLVPVAQSRELAQRLAGPSQLIELDSSLGHDAFLGDSGRIAPLINELLRLRLEALS
ncbi:MAG: homoserine O-acetyltransferase/O-succinyltransferase [Gemmatimonadaceae bacterium]|jgi:homoserine O-acetyltransferase|nr:homoserine O-acetyltransferase/O-succinyltransferase [Gemmatimonadaceae bacterium]